MSDATRDRGVDVGCALILESSDGRVLLTRRAAHLRTFPGIWVPPGKHWVPPGKHSVVGRFSRVDAGSRFDNAGLVGVFDRLDITRDAQPTSTFVRYTHTL